MAGVAFDKSGLDYALGMAANQLRAGVANVRAVAAKTSTLQQADLEALGYSADEAYAIKLVFETSLNQLLTDYDTVFPDLKKFMGVPVTPA